LDIWLHFRACNWSGSNWDLLLLLHLRLRSRFRPHLWACIRAGFNARLGTRYVRSHLWTRRRRGYGRYQLLRLRQRSRIRACIRPRLYA